MRPGDKFIKLFNELSQVLQTTTGSSKDIAFSQFLKIAGEINPTVRRSRQFLKGMGELRNAIVHDPDYPTEIIADTHPEVIERVEKTLEMIKPATQVSLRFQGE